MQLIYTALSLALLSTVRANPAPLTARQEAPTVATADVNSATSTAPESQLTEVYTGIFTAAGVYRVTSQSGYVNIAGHSLSFGGADALVGGVRVTVASGGTLVAGGTSIGLQELTATSTTAAEEMTNSSTEPTSSTGTASTDETATSSAGAEASVRRVGAGVVVLGGLGALLL